MQAACGIRNDQIIAACGGRLDRVKNDSGGVCALARPDKGHTRPVGPDLQLFAGGGTEGIACSQHDLFALTGIEIGQLGNAGGLAHAVDADDQNDGGLAVQCHLGLRGHLLGNDVAQGICGLFAGFQPLVAHTIAELVHQMHRHLTAYVGKDQLFLQIIVHLIVDDAAGQGVHNAAPEAGAGLFQTRFHLVDREFLLLEEIRSEEKDIPPFQLIKEEKEYTSNFQIPREKGTACFDADKLNEEIYHRKWQIGDTFIPFGMKGKKKISDYLTDRKFSISQKERQWVLCCGERIAWLIGERIDNRFRIDETTKRVVIYKIV